MGRICRSLSYANIVATLALFLAVGGGGAIAVAATSEQQPGQAPPRTVARAATADRRPARTQGRTPERRVHGAAGAPRSTGSDRDRRWASPTSPRTGPRPPTRTSRSSATSPGSGVYCLKLNSGTPIERGRDDRQHGRGPARHVRLRRHKRRVRSLQSARAADQIEIATGEIGIPASDGDFSDQAFFVQIN